MGTQARRHLEHYQSIDQRFLETASRGEVKIQETLIQKRREIEELINLETLRSHGPHNAATAFGQGYSGFGNGWTEAKPRILYPKERKRPRRHLREIYFPKKALQHIATVEEVLVPIRLDIDYDKYKLRDTFTWNSTDDTIPIELFAEHLCEDYGLPQSGFLNEITKSLKGQLSEHHPHRFPDEHLTDILIVPERGAPQYTETHDDDLRVPIKLDITVGTLNLVDQIEWDLNDSQNDPERYALHFCAEIGLSYEFQSAIAHAIREQCQLYTKSLFLAGHAFDGTGVQDGDLRQLLMPPIYSFSRPKHHMDQFAPVISDLVPEQLEKIERDREREGRRNRRQTRGKRGVMLPDLHDLPKTYRSFYTNTVLVSASDQQIESSNKDTYPFRYTAGMDQISDDERWHGTTDSPRHDRGTRSTRNLRAGMMSMPNDNTTDLRSQVEQASSWVSNKSLTAQTAHLPTTLHSDVAYNSDHPAYERQMHRPRVLNSASLESHQDSSGNSFSHQHTLIRGEVHAVNGTRSFRPRSTSPLPSAPSLIVKLRVPKSRLLQLRDPSIPASARNAITNNET